MHVHLTQPADLQLRAREMCVRVLGIRYAALLRGGVRALRRKHHHGMTGRMYFAADSRWSRRAVLNPLSLISLSSQPLWVGFVSRLATQPGL